MKGFALNKAELLYANIFFIEEMRTVNQKVSCLTSQACLAFKQDIIIDLTREVLYEICRMSLFQDYMAWLGQQETIIEGRLDAATLSKLVDKMVVKSEKQT